MFKLKAGTSLQELKKLFENYLAMFAKRHARYNIQIEKFSNELAYLGSDEVKI